MKEKKNKKNENNSGGEFCGSHVVRLTFSCLKKESILISRNTRLLEMRFWKTFGIFFNATRFPSRGSVTDLKMCDDTTTTTTMLLHKDKHKNRINLVHTHTEDDNNQTGASICL